VSSAHTIGKQRNCRTMLRISPRGVWALIQAQISQIDFDYASYAEIRLGEYYAWKREADGSRKQAGEEMPLRESRWASEE
jgi:ethanolamine kinase